GGALDARPRSHDDLDPAEVRRFAGDWLHQGQERDTPGPSVWRKTTEFRWAKLLGARVFRIDGWAGRRGDTKLHSESRAGGSASGTDDPLAPMATSVAY